MKNCLITTIQFHMLNFSKFQYLKELLNPHNFTSGQSHKSIFNFYIGLGNHALPRNNIPFNENTYHDFCPSPI